jgi:hypothetical protein
MFELHLRVAETEISRETHLAMPGKSFARLSKIILMQFIDRRGKVAST